MPSKNLKINSIQHKVQIKQNGQTTELFLSVFVPKRRPCAITNNFNGFMIDIMICFNIVSNSGWVRLSTSTGVCVVIF